MSYFLRSSIALASAGLVAVGVAGCQPSDNAVQRQATPVRVQSVALTAHFDSQVLTGSIKAKSETPQAFLIAGKLTEIDVDVGDHVKAGQVLARLAPGEQQADVEAAQAALDAAQSQVTQAQATMDRQQSLWDQGLTTRSAYDGARTALETAKNARDSAQAQLGTAQQGLDYTTLEASADGIITKRQFEPDEVVQAGTPVFVLAEDGPRVAVFQVQETAVAGRDTRQPVSVALVSDATRSVQGHITEVSPVLDAQTGTIETKVTLDETPGGFDLGTPVTVTLQSTADERVILPWSALWQENGQASVWIVDGDDKVSIVPITVESYGTGTVVVKDGLTTGQTVVVEGTKLLTPGQSVAPLAEESAS